SFSNILSEARKYRLDLTMAHQYMDQLDEHVRAAVIGNVGSIMTYRVGSTDAEILGKEFAPTFTEEDLINLPKYNVYLKLMIDGVASRPFSAVTLPPIGFQTDSFEKVVKVSRERYASPRDQIEDKIMRWSGMDNGLGDTELDEYEIEFNKAAPLVAKVSSEKKKDDRKWDKKPKQNFEKRNNIDFASLRPEPVFVPPPTAKLPYKENNVPAIKPFVKPTFLKAPEQKPFNKFPPKNPQNKLFVPPAPKGLEQKSALSLSSLQNRTDMRPSEKMAVHLPPEPLEREIPEEEPKGISFKDLKRSNKPNSAPINPQKTTNLPKIEKKPEIHEAPKTLRENDIVTFED
ncbi:MAG: hypothetical protein Q7J14_00490, partial [Candidatus Magasanikbacteria bacterium]|nr:hypothetical protein [Candidatus Magasanikbacteria bacterium]